MILLLLCLWHATHGLVLFISDIVLYARTVLTNPRTCAALFCSLCAFWRHIQTMNLAVYCLKFFANGSSRKTFFRSLLPTSQTQPKVKSYCVPDCTYRTSWKLNKLVPIFMYGMLCRFSIWSWRAYGCMLFVHTNKLQIICTDELLG